MPTTQNRDIPQILSLITGFSTDVLSVFSEDWRYVYVTPSSKAVLGYEPFELIDQNFFKYIVASDLEDITNSTKIKNKPPNSFTLDYRVNHKDQSEVWIENTIRVISDPSKSDQTMYISVARDITARKTSDEIVKRFVEAVESASDTIIMADSNGKIMYVNPAIIDLTGYSQAEIIGKQADFIWSGKMDTQFVANMWSKIKSEKTHFEGEISSIRKNGQKFVFDLRIQPIFDKKRNITFFVGTSRDITKAKEIDRMKTDFISLASHQLRTPLTAIKWRLELLRDQNSLLNSEQNTYIEEIDRSNERMIELVNGLLNITRIESGRLIIDPQLTSLEQLIKSALDENQIKIAEKKININLNIEKGISDVMVDPKIISNIYANILSNAVKYSPDNSSVDISLYRDENEIITKVTDQGFGIPLNEQLHVFEKFFRASNVKDIVTEGTGLGLYLAKALAFASNGRVWFESEKDKGSSFYLSLNQLGTLPKKGEVSLS